MKRCGTLVAVLAFLSLTLPALAKFDAGLINVALGGRPGKEGAPSGKAVLGADRDKWNVVDGAQGDHVQINDSSDELTDVTITYSSDGVFDAGAGGGLVGTPWEKLMRRYLHSRFARKIVVSGLTRGGTYDLVVFSASNADGRRTRFSVGKESQTTTFRADKQELASGVNYARFTATADADGNVTITYEAPDGYGEGNINGLQIAAKTK
jgi:hypothetical protein